MAERSSGAVEDFRLGGSATERLVARLSGWEDAEFAPRLWRKDPTLWSPDPLPEITDRLGWLDLPVAMAAEAEPLGAFAREIAGEGVEHAVVLGMGGSSLAPAVFAHTFGDTPGFPRLSVLDTTHPDAVRAAAERLDPKTTLFVVSSKSGTTTEMLSLFRFFWWRSLSASGAQAGRHFVAVTDPGTPLAALARERGFRAVFTAPPDVGGRYSALTPFGLVPAALAGADDAALLASGRAMAQACGPGVPARSHPGLRLGAALGELALAGREKVTFVTSPSLAAFPDWIEQLLAESTGKDGRGLIPVAGEPLGAPPAYGEDRFFVALLRGGDVPRELAEGLTALERAGHPVARFTLNRPADLGGEMFRWEVATAAAGAILGVHPFDQPDVQLAKELASRAMQAATEGRAASGDAPAIAEGADFAAELGGWLAGVRAGDYLGIQAYLPPSPAITGALRHLQARLHERTGLAVTLGYGPRFLHSTGQLHKGGPAKGRFVQLLDTPHEDVAVPEASYTFGTLIRAQADGDAQALRQRGRRLLRLRLPADLEGGLARLAAASEGLP
jgi:transaldolase/glucose-6-phosphate isomerase